MKVYWLVLLLLASCTASTDVTKIGVVLPLTGDGSFWGEHSINGMNLALNEINKESEKIELIVEDSRCVPKEGVTAIKKLIELDGVDIVLGDICSSVSNAMAPIAQENDVLMITPCSESPDITKHGDLIFRTWTPNNKQGKAMANHLRETNINKVGLLAINNDFGIAIRESFKENFDGEIVLDEIYDQSNRDFRSILLKLENKEYDGLFIITYLSDGVSLVEQINELGIKTKLFGTSGLDSDSDFFTPLGELAEGIAFTRIADTTDEEFMEKYSTHYETEWPGLMSCASVSYDDLMILSDALETSETSGEIRDYLNSLNEYDGVSGSITFNENGDLEWDHSIFIYENGETTLLTP